MEITASELGKRVRGLMSPKFTVHITEGILASAQQRDSGHCMIAEAVKAARPTAKAVSVDIQTIRFTEGERRYIYLTPRKAQVAIVKFDKGEKQQPWRMSLRGGQSILKQSRTRR